MVFDKKEYEMSKRNGTTVYKELTLQETEKKYRYFLVKYYCLKNQLFVWTGVIQNDIMKQIAER